MLVGAVHGYRGLVRELIGELKRELKVKHLPVIATGGYAKLIAAKLPEISAVEPNLTLEGLRLVWQKHGEPPDTQNRLVFPPLHRHRIPAGHEHRYVNAEPVKKNSGRRRRTAGLRNARHAAHV